MFLFTWLVYAWVAHLSKDTFEIKPVHYKSTKTYANFDGTTHIWD